MSGSRQDDAEDGARDRPDADASPNAGEDDAEEDSSARDERDAGPEGGSSSAGDDDREWRFGLDEVGEDAEPRGRPEPEPGSPSAENVLFVVLGVVAALGVVAVVVL